MLWSLPGFPSPFFLASLMRPTALLHVSAPCLTDTYHLPAHPPTHPPTCHPYIHLSMPPSTHLPPAHTSTHLLTYDPSILYLFLPGSCFCDLSISQSGNVLLKFGTFLSLPLFLSILQGIMYGGWLQRGCEADPGLQFLILLLRLPGAGIGGFFFTTSC